WTPTAAGTLAGQLQIRSGDAEGPQPIKVNGRSAVYGWVQRGTLPNGSNATVLELQMLTTNIGYAVTSASAYKTTNGGLNWTVLNSLTNFPIKTLFFNNVSTGYVA